MNLIVYELNEVPWEIVDFYTNRRPRSALADLVGDPGVQSVTTVSDESPVDLQPWRSWPTLHRSLWTRDHNSWDLGQDPDTFHGVDLWTVAARAGRKVGVFGALQSWPPRRFPGGFHVPDTFARTPATFPASLGRFQAFNLAMTSENRFAARAGLPIRQLPFIAADMLRNGLTIGSAFRLGTQLAGERLDPSRAAIRPVMQALPGFDLFWRLHQRHEPELSIFFTNHVASMLHRYWADTLPREGATSADRLGPGASSVLTALDIFDGQLRRMLRWQRAKSGRALVICSSMGQERVEQRDMGESLVVADADRLATALGIVDAEPGMGMYPAQALTFATPAAAEAALERLRSVSHSGGAMFRELRQNGRSVSFEIDYLSDAATLGRMASFAADDGSRTEISISNLGIEVRTRPSGGNTGEHTPRGILIAIGVGIRADGSRRIASVLDVAPSLLALLGVEPHKSMAGRPSLFGEAQVSG